MIPIFNNSLASFLHFGSYTEGVQVGVVIAYMTWASFIDMGVIMTSSVGIMVVGVMTGGHHDQ